MAETLIEWADRVWNFLRGCSMISPGCAKCYAMLTAHRFDYPGGTYEGLTEMGPNGPRWNGNIRVIDDKITEPLSVKKPAKWFVNSMSDLFHESVPFEVIDKAFAVMALCPQHIFQILTKRPERMRKYTTAPDVRRRIAKVANLFMRTQHGSAMEDALATVFMWSRLENAGDGEYANFLSNISGRHWPLPNVWLGVSVENQKYADERIPLLLQTPAAVRFVSYEPALGPVDFERIKLPNGYMNSLDGRMEGIDSCIDSLDWIIVGGESGNDARPFNVQWARDIVVQCKAAGVKVFVKQYGSVPMMSEAAWRERTDTTGKTRVLSCTNRSRVPAGFVPLYVTGKGGDPAEWLEELPREFPDNRA